RLPPPRSDSGQAPRRFRLTPGYVTIGFVTHITGGEKPFRLSSLTWSVYLPTFLFAVGQGAVVPVAPLFARHLGASVAMASLIVGLRAVGQMIFDMPAGIAVSRWGDKWAMVMGTALVGIVAVGSAFSRSSAVYALL